MCYEFSKRDKPGSRLQIVLVLLPYILVWSLREEFLKSDAGWLWFVSGFWFRKSPSTPWQSVATDKNKTSLQNGKWTLPAVWGRPSLLVPAPLADVGEEPSGGLGGSVVKSFSRVNSSLSSRKPFQGSCFRKPSSLHGVLFLNHGSGFQSTHCQTLVLIIAVNLWEAWQSWAVWYSLPGYPDFVLNNPRYISTLSSSGSISQARVCPLDSC